MRKYIYYIFKIRVKYFVSSKTKKLRHWIRTFKCGRKEQMIMDPKMQSILWKEARQICELV
jgi:hypothetical protein